MEKSEHKEEQWLTLGAAASRLKVHPTTLRRWADEGQIPFMLTPGGHRRFAASDVDHISQRRHSVRRIGPVERIWASEALKEARKTIGAHEQDGWLSRLDGDARNEYRQLGQQLMELVMKYLTADEESDAIIDEAQVIGKRYGKNSKALGLPLTEALRASMMFRDTLVATAIQLPENVRIPPASQARLVNRINAVLNTVQLGVTEYYDGDR